MKNTRKILSVLLVLAMLLSAAPFSALAVSDGSAAASENENAPSNEEIAKAIRENTPTLTGDGVTAEKIENPGLDVRLPSEETESKAIAPAYAEDEVVRVIVRLESEGLLERGYSTDEVAMGGAAVMKVTDRLEKEQDTVLAEINAIAAEREAAVEVRYSYTVAMNGLAVAMPYGMIESVRQIEGVKSAFVAPSYSVPEDMGGTASPSMYATKNNFGSAETWAAGYTGAGMRVAVVDTGLDLDHPSFAAAPAVGEGTMTIEDLTPDVISRLNASDMYPGVTADKLYRSEKVPYGFNYVDESLNVTHDYDEMGDHGTHVAGIVGANALEGTDVVGVAPDAQILVMKVFGSNGGAYFDDILAAIEDAIVLGADAINMSLGAGAGFDYEGDAEAAAVYASIADTDIILAVASGNDTTAAYGNGLGTDKNFTSDPDNGIVSSPATYPGTTVVASLDNESIMHSYIEGAGRQMPYTDVADYNFELNFAGQTLEYVVIGGLGEASDYEGVDVYGKVALISRGVITYAEKQTYAYNNGAIACVIYDNIEEDLINMYDEGLLPNIFVSKADGEALKAAAVDGIGTITVPELGARLSSPLASAGQISAFSSWGVSESLELTPDITAPGGSIYSTVDGGKYDTMSGTSMATPHIAGMSALVLEYLKENFPGQSDSWYHTAAEALIMSTASPIVEDTGVLYSPRAQGAGAANAYSAVTSPAYLTVNGATPKASLGDDDARSGVYTFSFEINNLTDEPLRYAVAGQALTDQVDLTYAEYGMYFMGETAKALDAEVRADYVADIQQLLDGVNGLYELDAETVDKYKGLAAPYDVLDTADVQALYEEGIVVPANGSTTVDVTVTLTDGDKAYMDAYYENGIYVDGFVYCYPIDGEGVELSVPFLAFYGDWSAARVFEDSWYHGSDDDNLMYNRYMNILWTDFGSGDSILGSNPYLASDEYTPAHNVLSPNGDGYVDYVEEIYLSMMRGAKAVDFTWTDEDGNVLFTQTADYVRKSFYSDSYGLCLPFQYSADYGLPLFDCWSMMDAGIENGDTLTLTVDAYLDDGDDVLDDQIVIPIHIDTVAPSLDEIGMEINEDGRRILTLTVSDNYAAAAIITLTPAGDVVDRIPVNGEIDENGETATVEIDVTTYDSNLYVVVCDYGGAEEYYSVSFAGSLDIDPDSFYAYRKYASVPVQYGTWSYIVSTSEYNGWVSFTDADAMLQHSFADGEVGVGAAEYVDGYILAVTDDNQMFAMKAGTYTRVDVADLSAYPAIIDMALDISTGALYALTDIDDFGANILLNLSPVTGEVLGKVEINGLPEEHRLVALACDNEGTLYTVSYHEGYDEETWAYISDGNKLYSIDAESGTVTLIGDTGYELLGYGYDIYYQSMTVDHGTDTLYWATYSGYRETNHFLALDKETGAILASTETEYSSELTGLFKPSEYLGIFDEVGDEATEILLTPESVKSPSGASVSFAAAPKPFFTSLGELTWSSSDETVLESLGDGVFYCASEGTAAVTVTNGTISATAEVEVVEMTAELRVYDTMYDYVWYGVNAGDMYGTSVVETAREPGGMYDSFFAAAYAEGSVYAFDTSGYFYKLDPETLDGQVLGRNTDYDGTSGVMKALAFNHADGYMYGIAQQTYGWSSYFYLVRVNLTNGATETVGSLSSLGEYVANLAVSPDGTFYTVVTVDYDENYNAIDALVSFNVGEYSIDWDGMTSTEMSGYSSFSEGMSMVWSVDDECLYATDDSGYLYWVDPATGSAISLGYLGATVCLTELPTVEPETHYGEVIYADYPYTIVVAAGGTTSRPLEVYPWNSRLSGITYTIADTDIATVDEFGAITGVAPGETVITVDSTDELAFDLGLPYEADVIVIDADVTLGAYLLNEFATGGSSYWFSFNAAQPEEILDDAYAGEDYLLCAGAYYNGKIYAVIQDYSGELNYKDYFAVIDPFTSDFEVLKQVNYHVRDMAFDYTTGVMYAAYDSGSASGIAQVDITTGDFVTVSNPDILIAALAVDGNGVMYAVDEYSCCLYEIEPMTGETYEIGYTGVEAVGMYQSMHWDYETGNLYWAQCDDGYGNGFYYVDTASGAASRLGTVATGCQVSALYTVDGTEPALPETVDACGVVIRDRDVVVIGETLTIDAFVLPVSVVPLASADIEWTSSDESVATVENGVVTGVSAGTATITATIGEVSSECTVTVLSEARSFYAYNRTEGSWISFATDDPSAVETVKTEEGLSPITAATLAGDTLYAYDEDGYFYTVDTETFERSEPMTGVSEMSFTAEDYDDDWNPYELVLDFEVTDLSFDEATGRLYMLLIAYNGDGYTYQSYIGEVDTATGALMNDTWISNDVDLPANLLVHNSDIYYVDCWISGMLNLMSYNAAWDYYNYPEQKALITDYWGMPLDSRGFIEDPLTGTVYVIRDLSDEGETPHAPTLYTITLGDGNIIPVGDDGVIGLPGTYDGPVITGLFIK